MNFRITPHSGGAPPQDAIERLWERLGPRQEDTSFSLTGAEIRATWGEGEASSARDERAEVGRAQVLEIIESVCERTPDLRSDWYAVSFVP
ncbi:MAG TPA: hypothetical protein VGN08_14040 [Solirubrobacteraceae bacterium]